MVICPVSLANIDLHFLQEHLKAHDFFVSALFRRIDLLDQVVSLVVRLFLVSLQVVFKLFVVRVHLVLQLHYLLTQVICLQFRKLNLVVCLIDAIEGYDLSSSVNEVEER